jgi:hypothetical protein
MAAYLNRQVARTPSEYRLVSALRAPGPKVRYAWANPGPWPKADYDHVIVHALVVGCLPLFEDSDLSMRRRMRNTWNPSSPSKTMLTSLKLTTPIAEADR